MATEPVGAQPLFALLGERWNYDILREVFFGTHRFGALQRTLGIAPNTLTNRLTTLVEVDLLERHRYHPDKDWFDYHLTDAAREIVPAWIFLARWSAEHLQGKPLAARPGIRHRACGELADPILLCGHCREPITGKDVEPAVPDPDQS